MVLSPSTDTRPSESFLSPSSIHYRNKQCHIFFYFLVRNDVRPLASGGTRKLTRPNRNSTATYADNAVTIQWSMTSTEAGSDSLSAAIQVTSDNFNMYNINVKNTYGSGTQAIAFTAHGDQHGYYGCGFYGYQDT